MKDSTRLLLIGLGALAVVGAGWGIFSRLHREEAPPVLTTATGVEGTAAFPITFFPERHEQFSAQACRACHEDAFQDWLPSDHAHANRPVSVALDAPAFDPPREIAVPGETFGFTLADGKFWMKVQPDDGGDAERYALEGVIAVIPLRQYLARLPGGRWQSTSVAYDPAADEWFDVFKGDERHSGEWGHWAGQGMNWNANCAWCHMTEYQKNFDWQSDSYHTTWLEQGVSCMQCHTGMEEHVAAAGPDYAPPVKTLSARRAMENCASCHSRRDQLTPDTFKPGDIYHQHFALALPDQPGLYHPDGQILDEDYVYASFLMSPMGHAGVTCLDCHNPHSGKTILPIADNSLCMRCHSTGLDGAKIIDTVAHGHHAPGSMGNSCVECHMPQTTYMQRDPRRDHGFLSPDPLMTAELGIPNACQRCHTEESTEWAVEWAEKWYGDKLANKLQRQRARTLAAAYAGEPAAAQSLLQLAADEPNHAWRATYTGLLGYYVPQADVLAYLEKALEDDSSMVRARAVGGLSRLPQAEPVIAPRLKDPSRNVRIAAEQAYAGWGQSVPDAEAAQEWQAYLEFQSDRVMGAFMLADQKIREGDTAQAKQLIRQAVALDSASPEILRQGAVMYSMMGDNAAAEQLLQQALDKAPEVALLHYSLALLYAGQGQLEEAIPLLENAVSLDPHFYRAWYNLALARTKIGQWQKAAYALEKAAPAYANDPGWQQTRAIVERQLANGGR
ncbi:ammonia-forming cytochrome c nitrite reductase subunit c552 [Ruficoccus sp. ZRK36]|uniref:ammonia-forming cytochrome c nitrite reductase subunit c552 n=1 Tax=Ruficoccus sp. ZRK36 TaxID=2866311 RepID=UPI001C73834F|nr:ammonia-forming cytochrome c nitrite reductase subunit c552 [Ruficoccus sp. ZRK36]QYY37165.1 ammonia-forming cytochrome c nitrite reductase subunit c552 [Ruficoccus sp. ZRK36]